MNFLHLKKIDLLKLMAITTSKDSELDFKNSTETKAIYALILIERQIWIIFFFRILEKYDKIIYLLFMTNNLVNNFEMLFRPT